MSLRTTTPKNHPLSQPSLMRPEQLNIANGTPLFIFNSKGSQVIHIEFVFNAGIFVQPAPLVAGTTGKLWLEGTKKHSSKEIAERFDFYGAQIHVETDYEFTTLTFSGINESFIKLAELIQAVLTDPVFPSNEFAIINNTNIERYKVSRKKVDYNAHQQLNHHLHNENKIYAPIVDENDYLNLTENKLKDFFETKIRKSYSHCIAAGDLDDNVVEQLKSLAGLFENSKSSPSICSPITFNETKKIKVPVEGVVQSGIRIAYKGIPRSHEDFPALQMVNLVLGGYFGSRLMSNIREDKGYTYGIGSSLAVFRETGAIHIATEVGTNVTTDALKEIHIEIKRMFEELIPEDELELARNYLKGTFIRNSDGIFAMADRFKSVYHCGMDYTYYDYYFKIINSIKAEELKRIAKKYFDQPYIEVVAGSN